MQQNRVPLKLSHEQAAAMTWKKRIPFDAAKRLFKHGLVHKIIQMVL